MNRGYVYILSNPSMPGLVKIGKTTRTPAERASELYQTGVPEPFDVYAALYTPDCQELELMVHNDLCEDRRSDDREFFGIEPEDAYEALKACQKYQLEEWLYVFSRDMCLMPEFMRKLEHKVDQLSNLSGINPQSIAYILCEVQVEELMPASDRLHALWCKREAADNAILINEENRG